MNGMVQQIVFSKDALPKTRYRTRDEMALLTEAEWGWSDDEKHAYIFPSFERAERHAAELRAAGFGHTHAVVFGTQSRERRALRAAIHGENRDLRDDEKRAVHQAMLERMHLD